MALKSNESYLTKKIIVLAAFFLFPMVATADVPAVCTDLARVTCAPGSYTDATGYVKSSSEVQRFMSSYLEKSRVQLHDKFQKILNDPNNAYFRDLSISSFGLKNSPQCLSSVASDQKTCNENLLDGLTTLAQKQILGPMMPRTSYQNMGSLRDEGYILANEEYASVAGAFKKQAESDLTNLDVEKKIKEKIFPKVKALIIERLQQLSISDEQKNFMINKIKAIQFAGSNCTKRGDDGMSVAPLLTPNAFYDPNRNIFKYCSGELLQSTSEFQIARTIGHELSHSIDPCGIAYGPADMGFHYKNSDDIKKMEDEFPLHNVISCLRSSSSVEAKIFHTGGTSMPSGGVMGTPGAMPTQPKAKPSFCENDQIGESFADWMGAEILPQYIEKNYKLSPEQYREGYVNSFKLLCLVIGNETSHVTDDEHPDLEKRINNIVLVNPKIRAQMGCPIKHSTNIYCNSEQPFNDSLGQAAPGASPINNTGGVR